MKPPPVFPAGFRVKFLTILGAAVGSWWVVWMVFKACVWAFEAGWNSAY